MLQSVVNVKYRTSHRIDISRLPLSIIMSMKRQIRHLFRYIRYLPNCSPLQLLSIQSVRDGAYRRKAATSPARAMTPCATAALLAAPVYAATSLSEPWLPEAPATGVEPEAAASAGLPLALPLPRFSAAATGVDGSGATVRVVGMTGAPLLSDQAAGSELVAGTAASDHVGLASVGDAGSWASAHVCSGSAGAGLLEAGVSASAHVGSAAGEVEVEISASPHVGSAAWEVEVEISASSHVGSAAWEVEVEISASPHVGSAAWDVEVEISASPHVGSAAGDVLEAGVSASSHVGSAAELAPVEMLTSSQVCEGSAGTVVLVEMVTSFHVGSAGASEVDDTSTSSHELLVAASGSSVWSPQVEVV